MATKITRLVQGDSGGEWAADLTDSETGLPIDLTNAVNAVMYFRKKGTTAVLSTIPMVIESPATAGHVSMTWPINTLSVAPGHYEGEIELTLAGNGKQTVYDLFKFYVREDVQ